MNCYYPETLKNEKETKIVGGLVLYQPANHPFIIANVTHINITKLVCCHQLQKPSQH